MVKNNYDKYRTIEEIYAAILYGEISQFPRGALQDDNNVRKIIIYLFEVILNWDRETIAENVNFTFFNKYKLSGIYNRFNSSPYAIIDFAYPGEFLPWELGSVPRNYWNEETYVLATRWLIEKKLKWNYNDVCNYLSVDTFKENNLTGMILTAYHNSYNFYDLLELAYPGQYYHCSKRGDNKGV